MTGLAPDLAIREDQELCDCYDAWKATRIRLMAAHVKKGDSENIQDLTEDYETAVERLARYCPATFSGLIKQLTVAAWILAEREIDRDSLFASGPAFRLVSRSLYAVAYTDGGPIP